MSENNELVILHTNMPSYLSILTGLDETIILVHKTSDNLFEEESNNDLSEDNDNNKDIDVTGSPLKVTLNNSSSLSIKSVDNCYFLWKKEEEKHCPISYEKAQQFIQEYWFKNANTDNPLSVWCVCDGLNDKNAVLLSAQQTSTSITRTIVRNEGYFPRDHPCLTFEAMCKRHFDTTGNITGNYTKIPLRKVISEVSNIYEIFGSKIMSVNTDESYKGSVYLEVKWNQCSAEISLEHASCLMTVQAVVGQKISALYDEFWQDLTLLELYIKVLSEYNSNDISNNYSLPLSNSQADGSTLINQIIDVINNWSNKPNHRTQNNSGSQLQKIIENIHIENTYDLTDQLWIILRKCSTYGTLTDCLNVIFSEVINTNNSIFLTSTNITSMSEIIRGIKQGKLPIFRLSGMQSIELLVDIGLEKLRKNYTYILTEFGVTNTQELNDLFHVNKNNKIKEILSALYHKTSLLSLNEIEKKMTVMGQLHTVLETLILVPSFCQSLTAKRIFNYYVGNLSPINTFADLTKEKLCEIRIDLPITEIYDCIKTLHPFSKRISLSLSQRHHSVESVFHLSQQPIFPPVIYLQNTKDETTIGNVNKVFYHFTYLTKITNYIKSNFTN